MRGAWRALALLVAVAAVWPACASEPAGPPPHPLSPGELTLRAKLGIPADAKTVLVFAQNAHLDIDWQKTFDGYYAAFVGDIFLEARQILDQQPRAFYSVAEMAFLKHHLEVHPEELAPLRAAAARGALRIVGGGVTSPDTLLPETELLARDWLFGIQFAEDTLGAHPHAAYLPDSFGHGATAPDVLAAAGYDSVAFSRVDGAPAFFEQLFHPGIGPKPNSTAELLQKLGTADFYWRGTGGARVLAHFMAAPGLYCMGDNLDYQEKLEVPGSHSGAFAGDDPSYTDGQISTYAAELKPYSRTPYGFVPVGCDFQHPKPRLLEYLDGFNQRQYAATGVWAVAASFEDYAALVSYWGDVLPEIDGELSPYYMGFYGSRADVKRGTRDAARPFFVAETFATALGDAGQALVATGRGELEKLTRTNHHDFVTGTSADDVVATEQLPLLAETKAAGDALLTEVADALAKELPTVPGSVQRVLAFNASSGAQTGVATFTLPISGGVVPPLHAVAGAADVPLEVVGTPAPDQAVLRVALGAMPPFSWRTIDLVAGAAPTPTEAVTLQLLDGQGNPATGSAITRVVLGNAHVHTEWTKKGAFVLTSLVIDGSEAVAGDSFRTQDYHDTGGLWRTGNEMDGCVLDPLPPPGGDESVEILDDSPLQARVAFHSGSAIREAALGAGASGLDLAVTTGAAEATTRTMTFALAVATDAKLHTSLPGGSAERPLERLYRPTFWPAVAWAEVGGWAILLRQSTGVRMSTPGAVELMAARDARSEQCDVEGGVGSDPGTHRVEWRVARVDSDAAAELAAQAFDRPLDLHLVAQGTAANLATLPLEASLAHADGEGVISAIKPADRGAGVIVRVLQGAAPVTVHLSEWLAGRSQTRVDLAERDLAPAGAGDTIAFDRSWGSLASVRLR